MSRTLFWLHCLNALQNFCKDWKLDINPNKTKVIVFCKKEITDNTFGFYYSHNIIEITDKYKYLGIVFKNTQDHLHIVND
jgi:hypothetical protein